MGIVHGASVKIELTLRLLVVYNEAGEFLLHVLSQISPKGKYKKQNIE